METQNEGSRRKAKNKKKREKFFDMRMTFRDRILLENVNYDITLSNMVNNTLMDYEKNNGCIIGKLFVSEIIIAEGTNGTVIYEGLHNSDMPVAVKRIVRQGNAKSKEYQSRRAIEVHQNIIPLIDYEKDDEYEYLAFERCLCDLSNLFCASANTQDDDTLSGFRKEATFPSPDLLYMLRAVIAGVVHLHEQGFAHTKLKPHNVLISAKKLHPRISNLGHCKKLDNNRCEALVGMDSFGLGCIIFFCFSKGENPFGSDKWEEANVVNKSPKLALVEKFHEASHLIANLLQPQLEKRLVAERALNHPLFWEVSKRCRFLCEVSGWLEWKTNDQILVYRRFWTVGVKIFDSWDLYINDELLTHSTQNRSKDPTQLNTYNYSSLEDLLRICRNTLVHHRRLPPSIKAKVGSDPSQIYRYFEQRFPNMLIEVYDAVYQVCPKDPTFQGYF